MTLSGKRFLVIMRHEKSIAAVYGFVTGLGASPKDFQSFVLERDKDSAEHFTAKLNDIHKAVKDNSFDCLILATKVNDIGKESELVSFLNDLKAQGLGNQPVILTHLEAMNPLSDLGLNLHIVENDNLGFPKPDDPPGSVRTGMRQLGPVILNALRGV